MTEGDTPMTDEAPPILGTWTRLYLVVLGELALCILGLRLLAWVFA